MQQRSLGRSGLTVSRLGLGLMTWGNQTDEHEARDQLTAFIDAGGTLLDTAHTYAGGASEELLGKLLAEVVVPPTTWSWRPRPGSACAAARG